MSITAKKIADIRLTVHKQDTQNLKVKGATLIPEAYANIFLLAKKKSGKTTVIENLLKYCSNKDTKFIFIVSTINKDASWLRIVKYWERLGHNVVTYDDIYDEDGNNVIKDFMDTERKQQGGQTTQVVQVAPRNIFGLTPAIPQYKEVVVSGKGQESKEVAPEFIIVLDDLGASMRDPSLNQLLKTNRHYKSKVIMSAQNLNDLMPVAIRNLDVVMVFGRVPDEKITQLHEQLQLNTKVEDFIKVYHDATKEPHQFLYIYRGPKGDEYRKGFNVLYNIPE